MFHCRTDMGDEQAVQLQELNIRLSAYLSRVRQLEQENQLLVEEIQSLQVDREVEWKRGYEVEITKLRTQLEELTVEKSRAEMERESLWQEFQRLKVLCEEVQAIRANIEKELAKHRIDLKKAEDGFRVLEEVLLRLQAEHQELVVVCEQEVANLRGGVLGLTVEWVREEKPHRGTSLSLHDIEEYAIEVSETWKETFQQYQRKVEELEEWVRVSVQNLEGAEEEKRQHIQQLGELRWQVEELDRMRLSLEDELRAMRDKFMLEVHEYQVVIETLEDEKQSLALTISERLKDYHELMQTKTDLSVEVATYRALLEGEQHNKGTFRWTEEHIRKMQQGSRTSAHEHITNYSLQERENARRVVPAIHPIVDAKHKTLLLQGSSFVPRLRPGPLTTGSATTVRKDVLITNHRPASAAREEVTYQNSMQNYNARTLPWHIDNYRSSLPMGRASTIIARETASNVQMPSFDIRGASRPGISQVTKSTVENYIQPSSYDHSWEFRETTTRNEGQGVSTEKTKVHEYPKSLSTNLPKEETKGAQVTNTEKTVALEEKPSRKERSYVFEIQTKDTAVLESGNTRQDGLITVDVPVKVNVTGKVHEKQEMKNLYQKEMKIVMNRQAKEGITQDGLRTIEIPIQLMGTRETQEKTTVIDKTRRQKSFIINEEVNKYSASVCESEKQTTGWEIQNDQASSLNQEISSEKTNAEELYKPSSQNQPKEESQNIKVTTVEKTVALMEKPSREETSYVSEIQPKDMTTSEKVNTGHEESISIDVPIKVIGTGKVHEIIKREDQNQKEMNVMVQTRVKLEGEDVPQEGLRTIEIPIQLVGPRKTQEKTIVIDKTRGGRSFIVSNEVKQYSAAVSESEELTRGWETQKDQTSSINQEISPEKTKLDELSEPSSQNLPKQETKSFTVTTIEKTVSLGEKPSREEASYVFGIRPKDTTVSTRHEESINIDVPIQIIGMGNVPEKNEREDQNQKEMNYMVHTQVILEGEDVAQERLRTIEIPIQLMGSRGKQEKTTVIDKTRGERSFIVNEELNKNSSTVSESEKQTSRWESRKDQTSWMNQEISYEKTKIDEVSEPSSQNLTKDETKSIKVTTVEKIDSLAEKPSREERLFVSEIRPKDMTVPERVNTRHEESIRVDGPIQIIGMGKVPEKNEREDQIQKEMNYMVHTQVILEGEDGAQERLRTIEIPIQLMGTRGKQEKTTVIDKSRGERSFIVNEEVNKYSAAVSESEKQTSRWETQKDQTSWTDQEISHEKTKLDEFSEPSSQNLPKEEMKSFKVTTDEKMVSLGEKPSREETIYVFEIQPKEMAVSERVNVRHEELTSIDVPMQVTETRKVQETNEREDQTQKEMNFIVHTQVKLEGEDVNQEEFKMIEIPIQLIGTTETQEKTAVIDKTRLEHRLIMNKEFKAYSADASEFSVESEEQTKGWDSHKDLSSSVNQENPSESLDKHDHTQVGFEIQGMERVSQDSSIAITVRSTDMKQANKDAGNVAETEELSAAETESYYNTVADGSANLSSKSATTWAEEFAEHVKISDILREFGHSTGLEMSDGTSHDAKVTYSETKQSADNGTVTTEFTMQSKTEEDFDLSDEEEIEQLLNSSLEKTTLKHLKGMQAESFLGNILHGGLKGKMGVRVEITEEPMELTTDEQGEFSVPFQVEEADDAISSFMGNYGVAEGAAHCSMAAQGVEHQTKAREDTTHVEDVTDGGDTGEYLEYIVSTPDDFPVPSKEHDDSLYGHVLIEEESRIRYSWEDDFLKSSQHKKTSTDLPEHGRTTETYHGDREDAFKDSVEEKDQETATCHVERLVIEKEIKVPLELQTSILGLLSKEIKDPKHQLKGALEQLEQSLPGILKEELSALSTVDQQNSNDFAVDIKKFEQTNNDGVVTIVAEINVSKTIDVDNLDVLNDLECNPSIIEEALLHSSEDNVSENLKSHKKIEIAGKPMEIEVSTAGNSSMLWSSEQLYSSSKIANKDLPSLSSEEPLQERPDSDPSKFILTGETTQMQTSADVNKFVRHIKLDPKEMKTIEHVIFEGPVSETWEIGTADKHSPTEGLTDVTRSVRHFKVGTTEIRTMQEFISEGSSSEFGEEVPPTEESTDGSRSIRHIKLGPREVYSSEQIIFEGPMSELSPTEGAAANNRFIRHIQLGAKEFQTEQQIIFQGPICESPDSNDKGDLSTTSNISTKHFKLSPTESQRMEHIIFHGPLLHSAEHAGTETLSEGGSSTSSRNFSLSSKTQGAEQIILEGPISEASAESSTHIRHIKISPTDGQIIFEGPISDSLKTDLNTSTRHIKIKTRDIEASEEGEIEHQGLEQHLPSVVEIPHSSDSADANRPITLIKLGPTEKSFTFQVDVSQSSTDPSGEGGSQQTKMIFSSSTLTEDPSTTKTETANEDEEKHVKESNGQSTSTELKPDAYEEYFQSNGQEVIDTSMFDRTIQMQRMVDQRSLISDDKKIAVVYLDDEDDFF